MALSFQDFRLQRGIELLLLYKTVPDLCWCQEETLLAMRNQHTGVDLLLSLLYLRDIENTPSSV